MTLTDIRSETYQKRWLAYIAQVFDKPSPVRGPLTSEEDRIANGVVTAEMLDEIHFMLRHLCGIAKDARSEQAGSSA